jgi:excisionase family DNA binding protein
VALTPAAEADAEPELIGTRETARRLGVHENTVRNWADRGELRVAETLPGSGYRRFDARDVEELRCSMRKSGTPRETGS